ncbi:hypothetical protein OPV22_018061 [Ensete ventricosum]|uniref:Protein DETOXIFICATION n=1 Tax=Ensete ventricosum TaxID=4639 RepID=A0AAV8PFI9_ENSVE|nr:hypothetical protein OPV22_018061 [Ensete ventricosum]
MVIAGLAFGIMLGILVLHVTTTHRVGRQPEECSGSSGRYINMHKLVRVGVDGVPRLQCRHQREDIERERLSSRYCPDVVAAVTDLAVVFAFTLLLSSVQPVLTGVAVGAGWQTSVAYINLVGIPVGCLLAYYFDQGVKGMCSGMLTGVGLQTLVLTAITVGTNWDTEAMEAESRIRKWGGSVDEPTNKD